jgi:Family of unknown function (DUF6221)
MSTGQDPVAWLRRRIEERLYLARHAIELGNAAVWHEQSSGVLVTGEPTESDAWHGTWATGDSSLTRLMEANDPRDTIARCEAELSILDQHQPVETDGGWLECRECGPNNDGTSILAGPGRGESFWPCMTVCLLASGYRHREGYPEQFANTIDSSS